MPTGLSCSMDSGHPLGNETGLPHTAVFVGCIPLDPRTPNDQRVSNLVNPVKAGMPTDARLDMSVSDSALRKLEWSARRHLLEDS